MTDNINQQMSATDIIMLVILSIIWGGSFFFVEVLVDHWPPLTIVTARVGLAAIGLWAIILFRRLSLPKTAEHWTALFIVGAINNALPFCLITWGQTQISSGLASILNATTPFFTVLIAGVLLADEKFSRNKIFGVIVGIVGTIILIGPEALGGMTGSTMGQLAVMGAALSYALAGVFARRFKRWGISPLMIATGQVTMAAFMLLPIMLYVDQPWTLPILPGYALGAMLGLALISTVLAYILYFRLISSAGATNAALVTFLIPVSAILLGIVILGESFTLLQAAGMALIAVGLIIMDGRLASKFHKTAPVP